MLDGQGGSDANVVVNGVEVAPPPPPLFDFGTASSPVETGYVRVTEKTAWADGRGYGWIAGTVASRDRGTGSARDRDFVFSKDATFAVDVRPGRYEVTVTIGDAAAAHDEVEVAVGDDAGDTVTVADGQLATRIFEIEVSEPPLLVGIVDGGGADVNALINALEIR